MMFYIMERDLKNIQTIQKNIIQHHLGQIIGCSKERKIATEEILVKKPEVVLIDFDCYGMDAIHMIQEIKKYDENIIFVMLFTYQKGPWIEKSYCAGIECIIHKPIDPIEFCMILRKIKENRMMKKMLMQIRSIFDGKNVGCTLDEQTSYTISSRVFSNDNDIKSIHRILGKLGMSGERGSRDILKVCIYLKNHKQERQDYKVREVCSHVSDQPKAMEQRIRRSMNKALANIANLGIEDYMNENFIQYANGLFDFEDVKAQMDYIRGKRAKGGKVNVKKFIEGLLLYAD